MKISRSIQQELDSRGVATVIVDLDDALVADLAAGGQTPQGLAASFTDNENSPLRLIAEANARGRPNRSVGAAAVERAPFKVYTNLGVALGVVDQKGLSELGKRKDVRSVMAAPIISLIRPSRSVALKKLSQSVTWGIEALRADRLWVAGLTGSGVRVAHLDTGYDPDHPCLRAALSEFAYFDDFGDLMPEDPYDDDGHGTHTAATIAGRPVKNRHVGVAPGASILSGKVIEGGNAVARVIAGMDWAVGSEARILNMSLGFRGYVADFLSLTQKLRERNVLPVFAVGNEGPGYTRSPGNYDEAISVGAHDVKFRVAAFSSSQRLSNSDGSFRTVPDLVAPGVNIESAQAGGGFVSLDGTSMATPHMAGLAALLLEAKPKATVGEIESAIFASCKRTVSTTPARAGLGWPDAVAALKSLTGTKLKQQRTPRK